MLALSKNFALRNQGFGSSLRKNNALVRLKQILLCENYSIFLHIFIQIL